MSGQETALIKNRLDKLESMIIATGRNTVTVSNSTTVTGVVDLSLGFTPTASTRVVASVMYEGNHTPYNNAILTLHYYSSKITASLTAGYNQGQTLRYLTQGTYYIDWIVTSK